MLKYLEETANLAPRPPSKSGGQYESVNILIGYPCLNGIPDELGTILHHLLQSAGVRVERVWHSGKLRAEQTARLLARTLLPRGRKPQAIEGIGPNAPVAEFSVDADVWEDDTLVVGHLPFMARLVALLTTGDSERDIVAYCPGSVVCLERADAGHWVLLWMIRPDILAQAE